MPGIHTPLQTRRPSSSSFSVVTCVWSPPFCGTRQRFCPRLAYSVSSGPMDRRVPDERDRRAVGAERGREVADDVTDMRRVLRDHVEHGVLRVRHLARLPGGYLVDEDRRVLEALVVAVVRDPLREGELRAVGRPRRRRGQVPRAGLVLGPVDVRAGPDIVAVPGRRLDLRRRLGRPGPRASATSSPRRRGGRRPCQACPRSSPRRDPSPAAGRGPPRRGAARTMGQVDQIPACKETGRWARPGSNRRPPRCKRGALAN